LVRDAYTVQDRFLSTKNLFHGLGNYVQSPDRALCPNQDPYEIQHLHTLDQDFQHKTLLPVQSVVLDLSVLFYHH
jgi:hypothetical protein